MGSVFGSELILDKFSDPDSAFFSTAGSAILVIRNYKLTKKKAKKYIQENKGFIVIVLNFQTWIRFFNRFGFGFGIIFFTAASTILVIRNYKLIKKKAKRYRQENQGVSYQ